MLRRGTVLWALSTAFAVAAATGCLSSGRRAFFATCGSDDECSSGVCWQSMCTHACSSSEQCGSYGVCVQSKCAPRPAPKIVFSDDFADSSLANWTAYGTPPPQWLATGAGRAGVFDNRGDGMNTSGALSKAYVDCPAGRTLEAQVYTGFSDLGGCWSAPSLELSDVQYPSGAGWSEESGLSGGAGMRLTAEGDKCWATPAEQRRHVWLQAWLHSEDGSSDGSPMIEVDGLANRWARIAIEIGADRRVRFLADDKVVWSASKKLDPKITSGRNIVLGQRSSGSAGKSYHDSVTFWQ